MVDDKQKTLQEWQQYIGAKILLWKGRLIHSGPKLVYGTLCAAALFPALEAAQNGDFSLLSLLADIGAGLISANIDEIKKAGEQGAPQLLQEQAQENPELRAELDKILNKLDVLELARGSMNEEERAIFFEQLQEHLHESSRIKLVDRSVFVNGDLKYSVVNTGDGASITYYAPGSTHNETHNHPSDPLEAAERERQQKLSHYLAALAQECQILPLLPVGAGSMGDIDITLDQIYIDLNVRLPDKKGEIDRRPAIKFAQSLDRLVYLGDPGSGKSTFIKMVARSAALDWKKNTPDPILGKQLIPVILILRELVEELQNINPEKPDEELIQSQFKTKITKILHGTKYGLMGFTDDFLRLLRDHSALFIFDGMDEVPQNLRLAARAWIEAIIHFFQPEKAIVTCRVRSYFDESVIRGYQAFTLAPFDEEQIKKFTLAWYRSKNELTPNQQNQRADDFFDRVKADDSIFDMATNPLLLTQMAVLHQRDTRLPDQRVKLYEEIVQLLLYRWQDHSDAHFKMSDDLANLLNKDEWVRPALEHLAFTSHRTAKGEKEAPDLPRTTALEILNEHFKNYGLAEEFLQYLDQRSGLLQGKGGTIQQADTYTFPHRTFQEYLAGCYLNRQNLHVKLRLLAKIAGEGDFWDVVFQLSIEERVHIGKDPNLVDLAAQMCTYCDHDSENGHRMVYWSALLEQLLGEENIIKGDDPEHHITTGEHYLTDLRKKLLTVATGIQLTPIERADAADAMDGLGYEPEDLYDFVKIPGDQKLPTFWIGKYPVTNLQYARFLKPENFSDRSLWVNFPDYYQSGQRVYLDYHQLGIQAWHWMQKRIGNEAVLYPRYWKSLRFGITRRCAPVVGISWYEAMVYGHWCQRQWSALEEHEQNELSPSEIRLPIEMEWEKAAGGTAKDRFPWESRGGESDLAHVVRSANTHESGIDRTTPVWTYPQGESLPYGLLDMAGNVWEWQANQYIGTTIRVMRGGAFASVQNSARCAYRYWNYRDYLNNPVGFRLCLRP